MASKRSGQRPRNFPGREDQRRRDALARRTAEGASKTELKQIAAKINPNARDVRTKKDRSAKAKFYRSAP